MWPGWPAWGSGQMQRWWWCRWSSWQGERWRHWHRSCQVDNAWTGLRAISSSSLWQPTRATEPLTTSENGRTGQNWTRINLRDVDGNIKGEWMSTEIEAADTTWSGLMVCSTWRRGNGNFNIEGNCKTGFSQNLWTLQVSLYFLQIYAAALWTKYI